MCPRATRLALLLRGLGYRRGVAAGIVVMAALGTAAAGVAPAYRASASVSSLRNRMTEAPVQDTGITVSGTSWPGDSPDVALRRFVPRLATSMGTVAQMTEGQVVNPGPLSPPDERSTEAVVIRPHGVRVSHRLPTEQAYDPQNAALTWRSDQCAHLRFVAGHCPTTVGDVAMSVAAATVMGGRIGSQVTVSHLDQISTGQVQSLLGQPVSRPAVANAPAYTLRETVTGLFTVPDPASPYWYGHDVGQSPVAVTGSQVAVVPLVVPRAALTSLPPPFRANVSIEEPLRWSGVGLRQASALDRQIQAIPHPAALAVTSSVPSLLQAESLDSHDLGQLVGFADIQLVVLVALATVVVVASSIGRRRSELVDSALRGRGRWRSATRLTVEPGVLLVMGLVPGMLLVQPLAALAARLWLRPHTPVGLPMSAVVAGIATIAVVLVATLVLALAAASRSAADQLTEDNRSAGGRAGAWLEVVAVTLAVVGLVEIVLGRHSHTSTPWSLLAPSLSGLALAVVVGRIAVRLLRPVVAATAGSRRLSCYLAVRALHRDRAAWRITAVVAMALALLSFAVSVNRGAAADRLDRAGLIVGADQVLQVIPAAGVDLQRAVDAADPAGRWAMAAELVAPFASPDTRTLAVDSPRLPAVAGWSRRIAGLSAGALADYLRSSGSGSAVLPAIGDGSSIGSVTTLNGVPTSEVRTRTASVLPQLLGGGALVDLDALRSVSGPSTPVILGTTAVTDQVWLGATAPKDALSRLQAAGLRIGSQRDRAAVARLLDGAAQPAGLDGYLAVGAIAAAMALGMLVGTATAEASASRVDELALTIAGVSRRTIVTGRLIAATGRLGVAAVIGLGCGLATAHLTGSLIPTAAPGVVPAPAVGVPTLPALAAATAFLVPALVLTGVVLAKRRRDDAQTARMVFT